MQVPGNAPIIVGSDLPVIKKSTDIVSTGEQPINGGGQYRLFATLMDDLSLTNCVSQLHRHTRFTQNTNPKKPMLLLGKTLPRSRLSQHNTIHQHRIYFKTRQLHSMHV